MEREDVEGLSASLGQGFQEGSRCRVWQWSIASRMGSEKQVVYEPRGRLKHGS